MAGSGIEAPRTITKERQPVIKLEKLQLMRLLKYGVTGVFATVIYFALLVGMVELLHVQALLASCIAFVITIAASYFINCFWTFRSESASKRQFAKYAIVSIVGFALTTLITYVGVEVLQVWYIYSQIVVVLVVPLSNYALNSKWVFS